MYSLFNVLLFSMSLFVMQRNYCRQSKCFLRLRTSLELVNLGVSNKEKISSVRALGVHNTSLMAGVLLYNMLLATGPTFICALNV